MDNANAVQGSYVSHSYCNFWNNDQMGVSLVGTDMQVNPNLDVNRYGKGSYFFIPQSSPLKGRGENGVDIGANILYKYVDGVLTNEMSFPQ